MRNLSTVCIDLIFSNIFIFYNYGAGSVGGSITGSVAGTSGSVGASGTGKPLQSLQISLSDTPLQPTYVSPTEAVAPNATGIATQIFWLIVNEQLPFFKPPQTSMPGFTTGSPQHLVLVMPVCAKGVTVTGTHTDTD